jgi:PhnB protein
MNATTMTREKTSATSKSAATSTYVQPYLFFDGQCEAALEYYRRVLGAEVTQLMRFKDSPEPGTCGASDGDKVMHASFRIGETTLMASDGMCENRPKFEGFSLSLTLPDGHTAERVFASLSDGGKVQQPLSQTFFASHFGMVADRFGVGWMIMVPMAPAQG